jgi:hypothetical protein
MVFRFLVVVAIGANLFGGPQVPKGQNARPGATDQQSGGNKKPVPPVRVIIEEPVPTIRTQPAANNDTTQPKEKPIPWFIKPEWVIVYVTAVYAIIAGLTLKAIKRQADSLKQQVEDARRVNADNAGNASRTLEAIQRQADTMERQSTVLERSVRAAETNAEAAVLAANTAKRALEISERADILVNRVVISSGGLISLDTAITVWIKNSGRTRAQGVTATCRCTIHPEEPHQTPTARIPMALGAGESTDVPFVPKGQWFTPEIVDKINKGESLLSFYAEISYNDVFGAPHHAHAHGHYMPRHGTFTIIHSFVD